MLSWIIKKTDGKKIVTLLILAMLVYGIMITTTIPTIREGTQGIEIFDLRPLGYSVEVARELLSSMPENTRDYYRFVQIPLDLLYPIFIGLCGAFTLAFLRRFVKFPIWLIGIPLLAATFDYLENIFVFLLLSGKTANPIIHLANVSSILKSMLTALFMTTILLMTIYVILLGRIRKRG